jgi:hypothetical protein
MSDIPLHSRFKIRLESIFNIESGVTPGRLQIGLFNRFDATVRRASPEFCAKIRDRIGRAFSDCLDRAVRQVANRPDDAQPPRRSHSKEAKTYALNSALDYESPRYHRNDTQAFDEDAI